MIGLSAAERLQKLHFNGHHRRFVVCRMGHTGSSWLARLLNCHPDVFCFHEGILTRVHPATEYTNEDVLRFIEYLAWDTKRDAYRAVGDVGSVWMTHVSCLPSFTTALLVRHPARVLRSRLAGYRVGQPYTAIPPDTGRQIERILGIKFRECDSLDQIFLHDALTFSSVAWMATKDMHVIRIEDMRDVRCCRQTLEFLTGLDYDVKVIKAATHYPVNRRNGAEPLRQILASFTAQQRDWYRFLLNDAAPRLGYNLMDGP